MSTNRKRFFFILLVLPFFSFASHAENIGKFLYASCIACHGINAQGNSDLKAPALAGQYDWYLVSQLNNFSNGKRGSHEQDINAKAMLPFAQLLDTEQSKQQVSLYLNQLPAVSFKGTVTGDEKNGVRYYQSRCGACHGGKAEGNPAFKAPKLSGQNPSYLMTQMNNFKHGIRGYQQEDKLGRQMAMMSKMVSEQELTDIIFYISQQQ